MPEDMVSSILPALLIGLIGLVVGVVAGYLLAGLLAPGPNEPQHPKNLVEAARLWRDKRSGKWTIEIDGQLVNEPDTLTVRQRDTLQKAQDELNRWVGRASLPAWEAVEPTLAPPIPPTVKAAAPAPSAGQARPPSSGLSLADRVRPASGELPPASQARPPSGGLSLADRLRPPSGELPLPTSQARPSSGGLPPTSQARPSSGGLPAVKPISTDLPTIIAKPLFGDVKDSPQSRSIAGQVDDILQERLPNSPFRDHVVRVQDSPRMGIQVVVDGNVFDGVGDVPYPDIQQFIRECVAEWERRSAK